MSKAQWINAYERIMTDKIEQFENVNGRSPTLEEELKMEASITEDEIRDMISYSYDEA